MSLFRAALRPPARASDEAVRRYLAAIRPRLEPDEGYRTRLRGEMLSRYAVARDAAHVPAARRLGAPVRVLARATLYASIAVTMSVGGVMAASQSALPGDLLYPVKREIETLRLQVLPAAFHEQLGELALAERINELGRLVEAGEWVRAATLAGPIEDQVATLAALGAAPSGNDGVLATPLALLAGLVTSLPPEGANAIERAMSGAPGLLQLAVDAGGNGNGNGDGSASGNDNGGGGGNGGAPAEGNGNNDPGTGPGDGEPPASPNGNGNPGGDGSTGNGNGNEGNANSGNGNGNGNGNGPRASASP